MDRPHIDINVPGSNAEEIALAVLEQIEIKTGDNILLTGKVQSLKTLIIQVITLYVTNTIKQNVILLLRNINQDLLQLKTRNIKFNIRQRQASFPELPTAHYLSNMSDDELIDILLKKNGGNLIIGLANAKTISRLDEIFLRDKELFGKAGLILDEGDEVIKDLKAEVHTKAERHLNNLTRSLLFSASVTATWSAIYLTDKIDQIIPILPPKDYYGLGKIHHIPVRSVRKRGYNPQEDVETLSYVMDHLLSMKQGRLLIHCSKLTADHSRIISFLKSIYPGVTYIEYNGNTTRVIRPTGREQLFSTSKKNPTTIANIFTLLRKEFEQDGSNSHIVIVSGKLAGRGQSFVCDEFIWHLTHQYLVATPTSHLETLLQELRLCGRYQGDPDLYLFCDQEIYEQLIQQDEDMDKLLNDANNTKNMEDRIQLLFSYKRRWISSRKEKGLPYAQKNERSSRVRVIVLPERLRDKVISAGFSVTNYCPDALFDELETKYNKYKKGRKNKDRAGNDETSELLSRITGRNIKDFWYPRTPELAKDKTWGWGEKVDCGIFIDESNLQHVVWGIYYYLDKIEVKSEWIKEN
jgi:hypothetical protein